MKEAVAEQDPGLMYGPVQLTPDSRLSVDGFVAGCIQRVSLEMIDANRAYSSNMAPRQHEQSRRACIAAKTIRFGFLTATDDATRIVLPFDVFRDAIDEFSPAILGCYESKRCSYDDQSERFFWLGKAMLALNNLTGRTVRQYHPVARSAHHLLQIGEAIDWGQVQIRIESKSRINKAPSRYVDSPEAIIANTPIRQSYAVY